MPSDALTIDLRTLGSTGLSRLGGVVREEYLPQLDGLQAARVYRDMADNDPVCSGILFAMDKIVRSTRWKVAEASSAGRDKEAADFLESCLHDMSETWTDHVSEFLSMLPMGHSLHEKVYKRRGGDAAQRWLRSKYKDGRVGWRGLPIRSQDTLQRWLFDDSGEIVGVQQMAPPKNQLVTLPMSKCLLFRTSTHKNSPLGRSIFRGAYRPWYMKRQIENIEAIGVERDLAGIPKLRMPAELLRTKNLPAEQAALRDMLDAIGRNLRTDEQAYIGLPSSRDASGNYLYDVELMGAPGGKQFDTDKIVQRYDQRIAMSVLADFLLMGQSSSTTGSFSMHTDKTKIFILALTSFLDSIAATLNDFAVPDLFRLNEFAVHELPRIEHDDIEKTNLSELAEVMGKLAAAGMPLFPNPTLEAWVCEQAKMPKPLELETPSEPDEMEHAPDPEDVDVREIFDDAATTSIDAATLDDDPYGDIPGQVVQAAVGLGWAA